jgi:hypothetical protein
MTVFRRDMIRGVRIDFDEREILVDVGTQSLKPCLSSGFLTTENLREIRRFLNEHWPTTPITEIPLTRRWTTALTHVLLDRETNPSGRGHRWRSLRSQAFQSPALQ